MKRLPLAVIGAGLAGCTHVDRALREPGVQLVAIADPSPAGRRLAEDVGVRGFADFADMIDAVEPEAVVIASPNATHARIAIHCLERGVAVLVEKPISDTVEDAKRICAAASRAGVPAIVGHQRRHNPIMRRAREIVADGGLGRPVCLTALSTWYKPADYFDTQWRREKGGGPILINLIHDIDQLRFLFGDVATVQAMTSSAVRGFEVEDTAIVLLRFRNGALGTVTVSDTAVAPWNWDLAAGEAERYPRQDVNSHYLSGTDASLTLPGLEFWHYRKGKGWQDELTQERTALHRGDPYAEEMRHFRAVLEGGEVALSPATDATKSLETTLAVSAAAASGAPVLLDGA